MNALRRGFRALIRFLTRETARARDDTAYWIRWGRG